MGSGTHLDLAAAVHGLKNGHVFFFRSVNGAGGHMLHGLAAADELAVSRKKNFNNIAARRALIDFELVGHMNLPWS